MEVLMLTSEDIITLLETELESSKFYAANAEDEKIKAYYLGRTEACSSVLDEIEAMEAKHSPTPSTPDDKL